MEREAEGLRAYMDMGVDPAATAGGRAARPEALLLHSSRILKLLRDTAADAANAANAAGGGGGGEGGGEGDGGGSEGGGGGGGEGGGGGGGGSGVGRGGEWAWRAVECRRQRGAGVEEAIELEE